MEFCSSSSVGETYLPLFFYFLFFALLLGSVIKSFACPTIFKILFPPFFWHFHCFLFYIRSLFLNHANLVLGNGFCIHTYVHCAFNLIFTTEMWEKALHFKRQVTALEGVHGLALFQNETRYFLFLFSPAGLSAHTPHNALFFSTSLSQITQITYCAWCDARRQHVWLERDFWSVVTRV